MKRRTLLRRTGALGALALAGCTGQADDPGRDGAGSGGDGGDGDESTPTATPESVAVEDSTFEVTGTGRSEDGETADAEFDTANDRVVVTGTIIGSDGCKTAALDDVSYDAEADQVTVAVVTTDRDDAGDVCTQALVGIDYEVTVQFSGGVPKAVSVSHDGDGVMSGAHGSGSASEPTPSPTGDA